MYAKKYILDINHFTLVESTAVYEKINYQMEKLVNTVHSIKSEKQSLIQTIQNMSKEIKSVYFKNFNYIFFISKYPLFLVNKRKHTMNKKYFNKLKTQMKKDLADIKLHLYSQSNNCIYIYIYLITSLNINIFNACKFHIVHLDKFTKGMNNEKTGNISLRKYEKLKMRLSNTESKTRTL